MDLTLCTGASSCFPKVGDPTEAHYLAGRSQFVQVEGLKSMSLNVTKGVPQGSVLGPFLYSQSLGRDVFKHKFPVQLFTVLHHLRKKL